MEQLISIPVVVLLTFLQLSLSGKFMILNGFSDLIFIWLVSWIIQIKLKNSWLWIIMAWSVMSFISAIPWYATAISYLCVLGIASLVKGRLWQSPLLSFLLVLIIGSFLNLFIGFISLKVNGSMIQLSDSFNRIILPSVVMNLVFALPIYLISRDMILWLYPSKE